LEVFVIRVAERRIDGVLDAALLDHETLEDFDDVRFEGEWSLFRTFASKKKRETILPKASSVFQSGGSPSMGSLIEASPSGRFASLREGASPFSKNLGRPQSMQNLHSSPNPNSGLRSDSIDSLASYANGTAMGEESITPKTITDILSGVLLVLHLYEVNPALVVQAFSQTFFWVASELFNRILTRKKYLCRTKAVQIKMNITALEDWVRSNGLPAKTATKHLEPVSQLLQWLQCSSQIREFDTLIGTMQNMKAINPLQMRKAVRDYRFEVGEGKMTDECAQYLVQLQKDWERRRVVQSMQEMERRRVSEGSDDSCVAETDDSTPIDSLFDGTTALADFTPQSAPECIGELLDSRFMLSFLLPNDTTYLVATPPRDAAYANLSMSSPFLSDGSVSRLSRPPSRSSFSSSRPMGWDVPKTKKLRALPEDFFRWLKKKETERRMDRDHLRPRKERVTAVDPPLGPSQRVKLNKSSEPIKVKIPGTMPAVEEEGSPRTPLGPSTYNSNSNMYLQRQGIPPPSPLHGLRGHEHDSGVPNGVRSHGPRTASGHSSCAPTPAIPFQVIHDGRSPRLSQHVKQDSFELLPRSPQSQPRPFVSSPTGFRREREWSESAVRANGREDRERTISPGGYKAGLGLGVDARKVREASEDTVGYGQGIEEMRTPGATTPGGGTVGRFWDQ
jgi:hypothetical protein